MNEYESKIKAFIQQNSITAEHLSFDRSCHSVKEAAEVVGGREDEFVKNICFIADGKLVTAIVKGEDRASSKRVKKAVGANECSIATPQDILARTGFPCGGTPSFGYTSIFLIDSKVMEMDEVYTGGGSQLSLVKISTQELQRANNGEIVRIRG